MSGPGYYGPSAGYHAPPPEQGYGPPPPDDGYGSYNNNQQPSPPQHHAYDPRDGRPIPPGYVPPHQPPSTADPNYFPPPPRQEFQESGAPPQDERSGYGYEHDYPDYHNQQQQQQQQNRDQDEHQLTPYDEEKAEAGYNAQQANDRRYSRPPPPADYDSYEDRDKYYDYRPRSRDRYDSRDRYSERRRSEDRYDRPRRRRDSRYDEPRANTAMKNRPGPDIFGGKEGERGLGAQLLGGAAGGLIGHEMGGGMLETLGGVVVGAIGARVAENQLEKRRAKKDPKLAAAPYRDQASAGNAYNYGRTRSPSRYDSRSRSRPREYSRPRRRSTGYANRDDYDDEYSRSPPRR